MGDNHFPQLNQIYYEKTNPSKYNNYLIIIFGLFFLQLHPQANPTRKTGDVPQY